MVCPDCNDTRKITLWTTVVDCESCKIATGSIIVGKSSDEGWSKIKQALTDIREGKLKRVLFLIPESLYTFSIWTDGIRDPDIPTMAAIRPRTSAGFGRGYNIGMKHVFIQPGDPKKQVIDGEIYWTLECRRHAGSYDLP